MEIYIDIIDGKFNFEINNNFFLDDDDIFITIDGLYEDYSYLDNIKKLYKKYDIDFINYMDIVYSIYIYDKRKNKLILVRDLVGLKPVYYYYKNQSLHISNDIIKLFQKYNLNKEINLNSLSMYFRFHYIKPPETIFLNTYKLNHGEYITFDGNNIETNIYWNTITKYNELKKNKINNLSNAKVELDKLINNYIKKILDKDKKYGVYLSGGIDSSLVTSIATKYHNNIDTFSIGFNNEKYNEANASNKIAKYLKTNHHELYIDEKDIINIVKKIPKYYTEPFADVSEFPTIVLNGYAKKNNIEIAFTGDGADQLFCGAGLYDTLYKVQNLSKIINPFNIYVKPKFLKYNRKLMYIYSNKEKDYKCQCDISYSEMYLKGLFCDTGNKRLEDESKVNSKIWQEKRMILDFDTFMCNRVNTKMGIAAKTNNIETKSPFLNKDIIEYSFRLPHKYKYYKRNKKYILKQILYNYIPKEYFSDNKRGFLIPIIEWLNTYLLDDIKRLTTKDYIEKQGIFNYEVISNLIKNIDNIQKAFLVWDYYIFQLWYEEYIIK